MSMNWRKVDGEWRGRIGYSADSYLVQRKPFGGWIGAELIAGVPSAFDDGHKTFAAAKASCEYHSREQAGKELRALFEAEHKDPAP